jgi:hypothetical protein
MTQVVVFKHFIQSVPKRCIHKVNIPYYNVYASFWDTLYLAYMLSPLKFSNSALSPQAVYEGLHFILETNKNCLLTQHQQTSFRN